MISGSGIGQQMVSLERIKGGLGSSSLLVSVCKQSRISGFSEHFGE